MTLSKTVPAQTENPLSRLAVRLKPELAAVNALILDRMQSEIPLIPELAGHLIAGGGKRIRPLLTLAAAGIFGYEGGRQHKLSACVEFIHTATLLHDDVVDESAQRRGKETANEVFGNQAAVLVGDFLFSRAFQLMVEDGSLEVLRILSTAAAVIAEGEVLQLTLANNMTATEENYYRMIGSKTAALFAAACETGAVVASQSPDACAAMRDYGHHLGVAFQISDDVLDYTATEDRLGKTVGDDFREGKMTLPVLKAIALADDAEREFWQRAWANEDRQDGDFARACDILQKHDAFHQSLQDARKHARMGKNCLAAVPQTDITAILADLIDYAVERDF